jgi:tRNA (guanine37-N1)-methyltransferase
MQFEVFTLLPEVFPPYLESSILQRARQRDLIDVRIHNIRDYTHDRHHTTDDTPYGGGGGMVMKPEPVFEAIESVLGISSGHAQPVPTPVILLSPFWGFPLIRHSRPSSPLRMSRFALSY